jgi:tRNA modification GTPase
MPGTIYALATGSGRAGIAVVRISGPEARAAVRALTGGPPSAPRTVSLANFSDYEGGTIDRGLLLWFEGPASFTGEDVAEIHIHGGRAIADRLLDTLGRVPGLRLADRGEFTRRAVENGKLDLTRAEAIADLVDAETEVQRKQAVRQYGGALYEMAEGWRARLIKALAWAEAAIDFADDEVPPEAMAEVRTTCGSILKEIQTLVADGRRGEILREGLHLTVIGPPNAGKSSLINALARRDVAIVSDIAGTTRDVIEARLDLAGYPVIVADTAGLRDSTETIEAEGVRRAKARAEEGDLILLLLDGSSPNPLAGVDPTLAASAAITVWNKADLPWPQERDGLRLSLATGAGLEGVIKAIAVQAKQKLGVGGESPALTRARHREAVVEAGAALERALPAQSPELMAEDLRLALRAIGRLTGQVDVEDLLDVIFRDFCIGK